ncbi:phage baseplate assembly protein J, partial [Trabulsiella guamensis ATCC 49490]
MPYNVPTLRKLITDGEKEIAFELGLSVLPPVGVEKALNVAFSSEVRDVYDHQSWIKDQIIPSVKSDDDTIIETAASEGVIRKQATFSAGPAVFTGTAPLPVDTEMQTTSGAVFVITAAGVPENNTITVTIQASDTGTAGNLPEGESLTLLSPVPGVDSNGLVGTGGLTGGADIEPVSELLDRLLFRKRNPPVGGAVHDYVIWAREMSGVSRAWAFDAWH